MNYLDFRRIDEIDPVAFRTAKPYPWMNPEGLLTETGYQCLRETLPEVSMFERRFGEQRKYGQKSHDRFALEYHNDLPVPQPWKEFITELQGERYRGFISQLLGTRSFELRFHWHYTPNGCSVSPHCDARRKLGSHIFYFNTAEDWDPAWGGETVILDDRGRFSNRLAPAFADFDQEFGAHALGNRSLIFARKGNSWHGVREIRCPDHCLRKVFIVVFDHLTPINRLQRLFGYPSGGY